MDSSPKSRFEKEEPKTALIVGANGQDGKLLTRICLMRGYSVTGIVRNHTNKKMLSPNCKSLLRDFARAEVSEMTLNEVRPDVIFHVAAAHASSSDMINFQKRHAAEIFDTSLEITKNILEWQKRNKQTRSVVALSSHMYSGINGEHLVDVDCIPSPISDYGRAKAETFSYIKRMRSLYDLRVSAAILFNHTSVHGRSDFIYPILASQICDVLLGKETEIRIRNFSSRIDISDAEEICEAMFKMSELTSSKDFVLGSGQAPSLEIITLEALKFFGVGFDVSLISTERISHSSSVLVSDIRHAKNFLDWTPMNDPISLLIRLVIEHLRSRQV